MSIVNSIYNAPVIRESYDDVCGVTTITIRYNGKIYTAQSALHPNDADFYSQKVGRRIALSRAKQKAMRNILNQEEERLKTCSIFLEGVSICELQLYKRLLHMKNNCKNLRAALIKERRNLDKYLKSQDEFVQSIKRQREQAKNH